MKVAYIGNWGPPHSTENHVARAFRNEGHDVVQFQEAPDVWPTVVPAARDAECDAIVWTHTHGLGPEGSHEAQWAMLLDAERARLTTIGIHLDRWWGLNRQYQAETEPFFRVRHLFTADGGHDAEYRAVGVNHYWMPPGVSRDECELGTPREEFRSDVAFVGSWQGGYHAEWAHRPELIRYLTSRYGDRCRLWPKAGEHAVRGKPLQDLYASTKVVVGDSCLLGGIHRYWSDRIPETLGRGGFLIHPDVTGLEEHYKAGEHLLTWEVGRWGALKELIDFALTRDEMRADIAAAGRAHVLANHTYEIRVRQILAAVG